jgi:hypothetical protein
MLNRFVTFITMRSSVDEADKVWMSELPAIIGSPVQGGKSASNVERSTRSYSDV